MLRAFSKDFVAEVPNLVRCSSGICINPIPMPTDAAPTNKPTGPSTTANDMNNMISIRNNLEADEL